MTITSIEHPPEANQPTIIEDLPCRVCGYNLRGLQESGVCPECGIAVKNSFTAGLLRFPELPKLRLNKKLEHWWQRLFSLERNI